MNEQESGFELHELFFSKTDLKGIIESGNSVFVRVSEYSQEEILHRPHNIVRHEDMPRCVFKLFWNFLHDKKPIAAYVKNKSKKKKFYWVFAMAFPMENGYISIRLKPTSHLFPIVQGLYKELLRLENAGGSMEEGIETINKTLQGLGFSSYDEFMQRALIEEIVSRDTLLNNSPEAKQTTPKTFNKPIHDMIEATEKCTSSIRQSFTKTRSLAEKMTELVNESQEILQTCHTVKYVTVNLTIASAKLGDIGKPLSMVSNNLEKLTSEIAKSSVQFEEIFKSYEKSVFEMYASMAISRFQIEMMKRLTEELIQEANATGTATQEQEQFLSVNCSLLRELILENFRRVTKISGDLIATNKSLLGSVEALSKITAGMGVIHVVGKIEMARTGSTSESLSSRLSEMAALTETFKKNLNILEKGSRTGLVVYNELVGYNNAITSSLGKINFQSMT